MSSDYSAGHVQEALAQLGETDVHITVVEGAALVLTGTVTTDERRTAVLACVAEHGDGLSVRDEVVVLRPGAPDDRELLS